MFRTRVFAANLAIIAGLLLVPAVAWADGPTDFNVHVYGDHIDPGASFEVQVVDLGPGGFVSVAIESGDRVVELGHGTTDDTGQVLLTFDLPADFPTGYATVTAMTDGGEAVSTSALVGREDAPTASAEIDARIVALLAMALGLVVFAAAGVWYVRSRRQPAD